jgi:sugar transferase (PEP-CTERM/EpsH1 system associated)
MRILFLTHRLPFAPNRGDRIRAYHTLQTLQRHAHVDLVSLVHDADEAAQAASLAPYAASVHVAPVEPIRNWMAGLAGLPGQRPLTHALLDSRRLTPILTRLVGQQRPDVVLALCSGMARFALEPPLAGLPLVTDLIDVDSLKWQALAERASQPKRWIYRREARCLARFEAAAAQASHATVIVNEREETVLRAIAPAARIAVVPNGVDWEHWRPERDPAPSQDVVFCGVMNYEPNEQGAVWLARAVWPLVRDRRPDARLRLVGSNPTPLVRGLAARDASIEVTGAVPDVRPYLWSSAVAAAPLHTARGVQNKVLEAVAGGLPVIVTPQVAEGLPSEVAPACRVAVDAQGFADALVDALVRSPLERRTAAAADLSGLSWERRLQPLVSIIEDAASQSRR